ncbi:hypothetical protein H4S02_007924, partial [Coemansia sp. RSA 2611]
MNERGANDLLPTTSPNASSDADNRDAVPRSRGVVGVDGPNAVSGTAVAAAAAACRQHASISVAPPLLGHPHNLNASSAAAVPIATATSPPLAQPLAAGGGGGGGGGSAPAAQGSAWALPDADEPAEPPSRGSLSSSCSQPREANLPFTYSGVFSNHVWQEADDTSSGLQHPESPGDSAAGRTGEWPANAGSTIPKGALLRGAAPGLVHDHVPSGLQAAGHPFDDSDSSSSFGD